MTDETSAPPPPPPETPSVRPYPGEAPHIPSRFGPPPVRVRPVEVEGAAWTPLAIHDIAPLTPPRVPPVEEEVVLPAQAGAPTSEGSEASFGSYVWLPEQEYWKGTEDEKEPWAVGLSWYDRVQETASPYQAASSGVAAPITPTLLPAPPELFDSEAGGDHLLCRA